MKNDFLTILIIISMFALIIVPSSVVILCQKSSCNLCQVFYEHINRGLDFFIVAFIESNYLLFLFFIAVILFSAGYYLVFLWAYFYEKFIQFKIYTREKLFNAFNCLFFDYLKQLFSDGIIKSQIYIIK